MVRRGRDARGGERERDKESSLALNLFHSSKINMSIKYNNKSNTRAIQKQKKTGKKGKPNKNKKKKQSKNMKWQGYITISTGEFLCMLKSTLPLQYF
jgi:hypothetical protein